MADDIDRANDQLAAHNEASLAAHQAKRAALADRPSAKKCLDCGERIPEKRRRLAPGCQRCTDCQTDYDKGKL